MLWVSVPNTLHLNLDALDVKSLTCVFFAQALTIKLVVALVKKISCHVHVNSSVQETTLDHSAKSHLKKKNTSVSTLVCSDTCIQKQPYILPIVAITFSMGKCKFRQNCLFDTGSQRTYFCRQVIKD